jgi:uncharacterized oligopeptide transporter (OPT) family protein
MNNQKNKYINKDDYMLFNNNMTAYEQSRDDKSVSTNLMKIIILILYIIFIIISIAFIMKILKKNRIIYIFLYVSFVYFFVLYYIKIAYYISKFFENNLLFKI